MDTRCASIPDGEPALFLSFDTALEHLSYYSVLMLFGSRFSNSAPYLLIKTNYSIISR